jgi:hypothetical protein
VQKVSWGATSKLLAVAFVVSLWPVVQGWITSGTFPTSEAILSAVIAGGFGVLRAVQQMVIDWHGTLDQRPVSWGPASKLLIAAFAMSLIPTVMEWIQAGEVPTTQVIISGVLLGLFAVLRVAQQVILDIQAKHETEMVEQMGPIIIDNMAVEDDKS